MSWRGRWAVALSLLLAVASYAGGYASYRMWRAEVGQKAYLSVPPLVSARATSVGFRNLVADLHFLNFVVYFGRNLRTHALSSNLQPVLELITDLDPGFEGAYLMGAMALGDAGQVDEAEALWAKGVRANPQSWRFAYEAGMNLFLFGNRPEQYVRAAALFHAASLVPGAPNEAKYMEARMYDVSLRRSVAVRLWQQIYLNATTPEEREVAARSLVRWQVPLPTLRRP